MCGKQQTYDDYERSQGYSGIRDESGRRENRSPVPLVTVQFSAYCLGLQFLWLLSLTVQFSSSSGYCPVVKFLWFSSSSGYCPVLQFFWFSSSSGSPVPLVTVQLSAYCLGLQFLWFPSSSGYCPVLCLLSSSPVPLVTVQFSSSSGSPVPLVPQFLWFSSSSGSPVPLATV